MEVSLPGCLLELLAKDSGELVVAETLNKQLGRFEDILSYVRWSNHDLD